MYDNFLIFSSSRFTRLLVNTQLIKCDVGLPVQSLEKARREMQDYIRYIQLLNQEYENGTYSEKKYNEKLTDIPSGYRNAESDAKSYIESIVNLMRQQKEAKVNALNDIMTVQDAASVVNHYDSLLTVNGNVDKEVLPELKEILQRACEYTKNNLYRELRDSGTIPIKRRYEQSFINRGTHI